MKIVHTADWHIGKSVNEFSMLDDQIYFLNKLKSELCAVKADVLIIAGDLYDKSVPPADAVALVNDFLTEMTIEKNIKVLCVAGNHDSGERLGFASRLCESSGLYISGKIEGEKIKKVSLQDGFGNVNFYLLPYFNPVGVRSAFNNNEIRTFNDACSFLLKKIKEDIDLNERNVLVTHGNFSFIDKKKQGDETGIFAEGEAAVGGADLVDASGFEMFDYSALGHIHRPKKIGRENIRYSGSLLKYSVDEASQEKEIPIVQLNEKGGVEIKFVKIKPLRDIKIIKGGFDEIMAGAEPSEDYVFAELSDSQPIADAVMRLRVKFPNAMGLKYSLHINADSAMTSTEEIESKSLEALFYDFYESMTGDELDEAQKSIIAGAYEGIVEDQKL